MVPVVSLSPAVKAHAESLALRRHESSQRRRSRGAHGGPSSGAESLAIHQAGAYGECAYAVFEDLALPDHVDVFNVPDFHPNVAIRTRRKWDYELYRRRTEPAEWIYVLVTLMPGPVCHLRGWMFGNDMAQHVWLQGHGGREPAWFVPTDHLITMSH